MMSVQTVPLSNHPLVLIAGSKGMLGRALLDSLERSAIKAVGLDLPELDITASGQVFSTLEAIAPDLVINSAAYTAVDKAESEQSTAFAVNRDGPANLAAACNGRGIPLIHISTDYVFDGELKRPYREEDGVNPLGVYGHSKWEGEEAIRARLSQHIIIRTAWLYGVYGQNFVKTIMRLAEEREEVRIVADQYGCPTSAHDLADTLVSVACRLYEGPRDDWWGTYHYCGGGVTTWHGFAKAVLEELIIRRAVKLDKLIPIPTHEYPTAAKRPANSALDCSKIERTFGVEVQPWRDALRKVVHEIVIH